MLHYLIGGTGNDPEEDSDREPEPAPKVAEKTLPRSSKRNAPDVAPSESRGGGEAERGGRGGRRGGHSGNDDGMSTETPISRSPRRISASINLLLIKFIGIASSFP